MAKKLNSFEAANQFLGTNERRKMAPDLYAVRWGRGVGIVFHDNVLILFELDKDDWHLSHVCTVFTGFMAPEHCAATLNKHLPEGWKYVERDGTYGLQEPCGQWIEDNGKRMSFNI